MKKSVIVVGAGMAGLTAARILAEKGSDVLLIEANNRIGGRLHTLHLNGVDAPIELGAEFVHGCPPDLLALIEEAGLEVEEVEGENYCREDGKLQSCGDNSAFDVLDALENYDGADLSFAEYLRRHPIDEALAKQAVAYVEGFNAADAEKISVHALAKQQRAEEAIEGDRAFRLKQGYTALANYLHTQFSQAGGRTLLQTRLEQLAWRPRSVNATVRNADGSTQQLTANQAVIAIPLGVLRSGSVKFFPRPGALEATRTLRMGPILRLVLVFKQRFWATKEQGFADMSFLFTDTLPGVWWTRSPSAAPVLTAWIGGSRTSEVNPENLVSKALNCLSQTFDLSRDSMQALLSSSHFHDWNHDPFALGAYSYAQMEGIAGSASLSQPIDSTLFIAGEHTDITGHWGTVHGALRSGKRAAQQILESSLDTV